MRRSTNLKGPLTGTVGAFVLLALAACLSISSPPEGLSVLSIIGGNNQVLSAGSATASAPLVVQALDQSASPMARVAVNWSITSGTGMISANSSTTNDSGNASIAYTPGATAGSVFVKAVAEDLSVTFTITLN